ncbi:hypothetical protein AFK68_09445 [Hydrocoleum sp. CS-953]|nr:hypothetical protein AFK68_09445 [Hydrocoleum sp. CS-953]
MRWHIYKLQEVSKQLKALYYRQFILTIACFMFPVPCSLFPARSAISNKKVFVCSFALALSIWCARAKLQALIITIQADMILLPL